MRQPLTPLVIFSTCLLLALCLLLPRPSFAEKKSEKKAEKKTEKKAEKKTEKKAEAKSEKKEKGGKEEKPEAAHAAEKPPPLDALWEEAQALFQLGDIRQAARLFYLVHYFYPEDAKGEPALWQAANLQKEIAQSSAEPDWDKVLNHFRRYINYYPKSPRAAEAYFELGKTYNAMRYYREAQAYFKLFMERFPDSPQVPQAMGSYRNSILRAGRGEEAAEVFKSWQKSPNATIRLMGESGGGILKSLQGDYQGALTIYDKVLAAAPDYSVADPEILRYAGIANLRLNKTSLGREQLFHYLSLAGYSAAERSEVMAELAESYFKSGEHLTAHKLYRQVISEGGGSERAVLLSNLRQAQAEDDPTIPKAKWERSKDLSDKEGDKPYLAVLEKLYRDPIAQEARFGMFNRYQARGELDKAYEVGRNFLRTAEPAAADTPLGKQVGQILHYLVEELLKNKRYPEIYDLYNEEYRYIKDYPSAKLHAMIGQALEALALYEPAAALFYRALQWPMSDGEKDDLYFRRARAYLALKDLDAADRLLTYMTKTYQGKPQSGEIAYYDAKLKAARGKTDEARNLYLQALKEPTFPEKRPAIADEAMEFLVGEARLDHAVTLLSQAAAEKWLAPEKQQGWWLKIGNGWRGQGDPAKARNAYEKGLDPELPSKGEISQEIRLYLGDVLIAQGDKGEALKQYQAAEQGENSLWKRMAAERLAQQDLDSDMAAMKKKGARR